MANRAQLHAETRGVVGKKVRQLRKQGMLPATMYGHNIEPQTIQIRSYDMRDVLRQAGTTQLIDLTIDDQPPRPVLIRQTAIDARRNALIHVEFFQANLREKITTHVPLSFVGESPAVKEGGIELHVIDRIDIESLPQDVPESGIEVDVSKITEINGALHVSDLVAPRNVVILTDADEVVAKVNPPVSEEVVEEVLEESQELPGEIGGEETPAESAPEA